jgi:glycosyltransferase involved in cell wall biosynthesis
MQMSQRHNVWVITRADHGIAIDAEIKKNPTPNVHWIYYDLPYWMRFWRKGLRGINIHYYLWQLGAYFTARRYHRDVKFDLIQHITYVRFWMPSFMSLIDAPFIWGPVGGGETIPKGFYKTLNRKDRYKEYFRNIIRMLGVTFDPFVRRTANRAALRLATTSETAQEIRKLTKKPIYIMSETALPDEDREILQNLPPSDSPVFRFVSIGRLLAWKGFHLGLQSFAKFQQNYPESEYWVIGDGSQRANLEQLVKTLGIEDKVRFWGVIPREQVLERLAECNVLVHPSMHDSGGWVCLEAMASRRPVLCLDTGGPGVQVTEQTGIKVKPTTSEKTIGDMADAMLRLANNPDLLREMGEAGHQRVADEFSWTNKGKWLDGLYNYVLETSQDVAAPAPKIETAD